MATQDPTDDGRVVSLSIPAGNEAFLRCVIGAAREGVRDDLEHFGDKLRKPRSRLLLEDAAYAALLDGLDRGRIVPDDELRAALVRLAESVDRGNEYSRVVFEHNATHRLLAQLGEAVGR